nr:MAG TPA: hypothetical protein [Caudoviricetes sp.]
MATLLIYDGCDALHQDDHVFGRVTLGHEHL